MKGTKLMADDGRWTTGNTKVFRRLWSVVCGLALYLIPCATFTQGINIIPKPSKVEFMQGFFNFQQGLDLKTYGDDDQLRFIMAQFAGRLYGSGEWKVPASTSSSKIIVLRKLTSGSDSASDESYRLTVAHDSMIIEAHTYSGVFYGTQSASQIFMNSLLSYQVPCMIITDTPTFSYRGMHLDVCRHFFNKDVIKEYIDLMARLKLNKFHWHLTDDQGWRIEIKKYPKLTEIGAWRTEKDGTKYGGFYTRDDIREIVAYAQDHFITIIPEIEMPGHSSAAIAAYPWLGCNQTGNLSVPNHWGVFKDIYCPGDSTFRFLKDVMDEVCTLFPGKLIHMGGDEVPKEEWKKSTIAQTLIKNKNLKNEEELQHYFLKQMEDYLATKGKRCIGWGEIVKGGLSDSVVVMSWLDKSAGKTAAQHGNEVIMTPRFFCYFDYPQTVKDKKQAWWMLYLTERKVYQFNPQIKSLPRDKQKLILGGQANVWAEYIPDEKQLFHQVVPRLAAMAEALWTRDKDFEDFRNRLGTSNNLFTIKYPVK